MCDGPNQLTEIMLREELRILRSLVGLMALDVPRHRMPEAERDVLDELLAVAHD